MPELREDMGRLGVRELLRKHGWGKVARATAMMLAGGCVAAVLVWSYTEMLDRRFGKGSLGAALGVPAAIVLINAFRRKQL